MALSRQYRAGEEAVRVPEHTLLHYVSYIQRPTQSSPLRWVRAFRQNGGMPNVTLTPPSDRFLSLAEREEIALLRAQQHSVREIARRIGRPPSTILRELTRNAAINSAECISLIEESGVIIEIGYWIFQQAARLAKRMREEFDPSRSVLFPRGCRRR